MTDEFRDELKGIFKRYKLGHLCKIIDPQIKWAFGNVFFATTWLHKYIVYEKDGHVQSVKDTMDYFYQRGKGEE